MKKLPSHFGHRQRLRKRFNEAGIKSLSDYEQLELLLTYAVPRKDMKPVCKRLINEFNKISGVLDAEIQELTEIEGVGEASSTLIKLVRELSTVYLEEKTTGVEALLDPKSVVDFARLKIGAAKNETFLVILVNTKNEVIDHEVLDKGTVDNVAIYPRKVVELAIRKHATGVILVHNHPSGHTEPSDVDKEVTKEIVLAARSLDIRVLDHIIVSKKNYFSFLKNGLLDDFKKLP